MFAPALRTELIRLHEERTRKAAELHRTTKRETSPRRPDRRRDEER